MTHATLTPPVVAREMPRPAGPRPLRVCHVSLTLKTGGLEPI
jgi:hypothetical protein